MAEHRIARARRLTERIEAKLVDARVENAANGSWGGQSLAVRVTALTTELATAEDKLRELLVQRAQDNETEAK
jgi:hypothetical protein